jgi:hypothetical protein
VCVCVCVCVQGAVRKRLLARWTRDGLVDERTGTRVALPVDNYEGMCLSPHLEPDGSRLLLLVNDDNGNARQIGTQFVLLALLPTVDPSGSAEPLDSLGSGAQLGESPCHDLAVQNTSCGRGCVAGTSVGVALLVLAIVAVALLLRRRRAGVPLWRKGPQLSEDPVQPVDPTRVPSDAA